MNLAILQSIISTIIGGIHVAEQIFPRAGSGAQKLEHALNVADAAIEGAAPALATVIADAAKVKDVLEQLKAKAKPLIEQVVALFNHLGLFQHRAPVGYTAEQAPLAEHADAIADHFENHGQAGDSDA
jgi:hypothetical protein